MKVQYQGSVREADPFPWRRTWKYKCMHFTSSVQGKSSDCDLHENQSPLLNFPGNGLHKNLRSKPLGIAIKKEHAFDYQLWSGIWEAASIGGKERRKHTPQGVAHARSLGERPAPGEDEWGASPAASAATHPDRWHRSSSNGPWGRYPHRRNFIWEFKVLKKIWLLKAEEKQNYKLSFIPSELVPLCSDNDPRKSLRAQCLGFILHSIPHCGSM